MTVNFIFLLAVEDDMKTVILIIIMRGWGGEAVAVHSIDYSNLAACEKAAKVLAVKEKQNKVGAMKHLKGTYICTEK